MCSSDLVRPHLERMRDVGLLEVDAGSRGTVGRPQHRYSLAGEAPSLGLEPSSFRMLAGLLAAAASSREWSTGSATLEPVSRGSAPWSTATRAVLIWPSGSIFEQVVPLQEA